MGNTVSNSARSVGAGVDYGQYEPIVPAVPVVPEVRVAHNFKREALGSMSQVETNGGSLLGTRDAPRLPDFLEDNPLPNGYPWSKLTSRSTSEDGIPNTGVTRQYEFTLSRGKVAPDGYLRDVILVNGEFPGPLIEANWGDVIEVKVNNEIWDPWEGFAMHWHGFLHTGAPWEDGTPGVTQCPIAPGHSLTYRFVAELYGTSWYHSHYSAQYAGGVSGPMVIHGPKHAEYDIDIGPVMIADWYHWEYHRLVKHFMTPNFTAVYADVNLINGKTNFDCSTLPPNDTTPCNSNAGISQFKFERGKKHLLRLINHGAEGIQRFSIDEHKMTVVSSDFTPIVPYETDVITLGIGQRADVIVEANAKGDAFYLRANLTETCFHTLHPNSVAAIFYDDAPEDTPIKSIPWNRPDPGNCVGDPLNATVPLNEIPVPEPDITFDVDGVLYYNETGHILWKMDNVTMRTNYNSPTLLLSVLNNNTFEEEWNVRDLGNAKSVRINYYNGNPLAHPMHMHGFEMYILHEGPDRWDGETIVNPHNPLRRDTENVRPLGHLTMQFDAEKNPGLWPFHCHLAWHVSMGMFMQFLIQPDEVANMKPPQTIADTCRQWGKWTETNIPEQIDSGL